MPPQSSARAVARGRRGYENLRAEQEEAIRTALAGHDTLCVMPTGSGKSAIYQIAGHLLPRSTIVVSPLIALQRDQLEALNGHDVGDAAAMNSSLPTDELRTSLDALVMGELEFLLLGPEQLVREEVLARVREAKPSLFVVDEAHCVSHWGHDFRPDYSRLGDVVDALGHPTVLAGSPQNLTGDCQKPVRSIRMNTKKTRKVPGLLKHSTGQVRVCLSGQFHY